MDEQIKNQIVEAEKKQDIGELARLTGFDPDVITGKRVMTRKDRRQWYRDNKSRLKLPKWGELEKLKTK